VGKHAVGENVGRSEVARRFWIVQPWISLAVRLGAAAIMIWAGVAKLMDPPSAVRATRAFRILPEALVPFVGHALPYLELTVGFLLLIGLFVRWVAVVYLLMMAAFIAGTAWAWIRGYQIDCGCFGGGGDLAAGVKANYVAHMIQRVEFVALGVWLLVLPQSALSFDRGLKSTG
jgi:uncharacterized membrane protein YphA (DoxX/SURF4 family)